MDAAVNWSSGLGLLLTLLLCLPAVAQQPVGRSGALGLLERYDGNGDGVVDMAELRAERAARFDRLDPSREGRVGKADFLLAVARSPAADQVARLDQLFDRMDADGDGVLTRGEYLAYAERWFDRMDRNGDGQLTRRPLGPTGDRTGEKE